MSEEFDFKRDTNEVKTAMVFTRVSPELREKVSQKVRASKECKTVSQYLRLLIENDISGGMVKK